MEHWLALPPAMNFQFPRRNPASLVGGSFYSQLNSLCAQRLGETHVPRHATCIAPFRSPSLIVTCTCALYTISLRIQISCVRWYIAHNLKYTNASLSRNKRSHGKSFRVTVYTSGYFNTWSSITSELLYLARAPLPRSPNVVVTGESWKSQTNDPIISVYIADDTNRG